MIMEYLRKYFAGIAFVIFFLSCLSLSAQNVAITDNESYTAHPSAMLDVKSVTKGMLVPRLTTVQREGVSNPATGLLVFDTDEGTFYFYNGTAWVDLSAPGGEIWILDGSDVYLADNTYNVGIGSSTPAGKLEVRGDGTAGVDDPLFEVINYSGDTVFAVYTEGVRIWVGDDSGSKASGSKGGFAVGGFSTSKGMTNEYLRVTADSVRVYIDDEGGQKASGSKGGFAVGGFSTGKEENYDYFNISGADSAEVINPSEARMVWYPAKEAFLSGRVLIESVDSVGTNSMATGFESKSIGNYSQALGYRARAFGKNSTAIGNNANARGNNSYAIGDSAIAKGNGSYAIGSISRDTTGAITDEQTSALGDYSIALGLGAKAEGKGSMAIGASNRAAKGWAFAIGRESQATDYLALAIGYQCVASSNDGACAVGYQSTASGTRSTAVGRGCTASSVGAVAIGNGAEASGSYSLAVGGATASGWGAHAWGSGSVSSANSSIAIGINNSAADNCNVSIGYGNSTEYTYSTALGINNTSTYQYATSVGYSNEAYHLYSTAIGYNNSTQYLHSVALGSGNTANNWASIAMGYNNTANGDYSTVIGGEGNTSHDAWETVFGRYAETGTGSQDTWGNTDRLFVVGNGTGSSSRSNALVILKNARTGINRTPTSNRLEVGGNASKNVAGDWLANSDRRIKTDIRDIENPMETVLKLRPVIFRYTDEWLERNPSIEDRYYYNFIAQEYAEIFPGSVKGSGEYLEDDDEEILQIDTYNAQIVTIKAVQELIGIVKELKEENAALRAEIHDIRSEINYSANNE